MPSPYRTLTPERRLALLTAAIKADKTLRALLVARVASKGRGFRSITLQAWPADKLAREVVRLNAESAQEELLLLQYLYVDLEPQYQVTFFDAMGVTHAHGVLPEELEVPYAGEEAVARGVQAVLAAHGDAGLHYLQTVARYNLDAWPGLDRALAAHAG
jgi:hypothetical protein